MKNILFLLGLVLAVSCNSKKEEPLKEEVETIDTTLVETQEIETGLFVWRATPEYEKMKNPSVSSSLPVDSLIKGLNLFYPNVLLEKVKQSGDTLYTKIEDSQYLGNQMGTTGAEIYLADVILNLTTVPGINFVSIDMEEQSHTQGGVWSKENFKQYKEKKP